VINYIPHFQCAPAKVVKVVSIMSHQIFKIYEKEIKTKMVSSPKRNNERPSLKQYDRYVQTIFLALMVCSFFHSSQEKENVFSLSPGFSLRSTP